MAAASQRYPSEVEIVAGQVQLLAQSAHLSPIDGKRRGRAQ
jgi:hypothetical protein